VLNESLCQGGDHLAIAGSLGGSLLRVTQTACYTMPGVSMRPAELNYTLTTARFGLIRRPQHRKTELDVLDPSDPHDVSPEMRTTKAASNPAGFEQGLDRAVLLLDLWRKCGHRLLGDAPSLWFRAQWAGSV
jgi:hypothetical protein